MAKIHFDIKYKPQIESGEYKVETENGFPATILDWSFRKDSGSPYICVKITRDGTDNAFLYSEDGKRAVNRVKDNDLIIITPESEDERIRTFGIDIDGRYCITIQEIDDIPCLCVHKCEIKGGMHWTTMDEKSFLIGVPIRPILKLCNSRPWIIKGEK